MLGANTEVDGLVDGSECGLFGFLDEEAMPTIDRIKLGRVFVGRCQTSRSEKVYGSGRFGDRCGKRILIDLLDKSDLSDLAVHEHRDAVTDGGEVFEIA